MEGGCTTLKNEVSSLFTKMKLMAIMSMMSFFIQVMVIGDGDGEYDGDW